MAGIKLDSEKIRWDLLPGDAIWELAKVLTMGARKYGDRNWEDGIGYTRLFAALQRHAWKWYAGEQIDSDDGQPHLASVLACAAMLMHYECLPERYKAFDNRPMLAHNWVGAPTNKPAGALPTAVQLSLF